MLRENKKLAGLSSLICRGALQDLRATVQDCRVGIFLQKIGNGSGNKGQKSLLASFLKFDSFNPQPVYN